MELNKSYDSLLNELIQSHLNKSGKTPSLLLRIFYSGVAVLAWGIYRSLQWVLKQVTPSRSSSAMLDVHAADFGVSRLDGESDSDLLSRLMDLVQNPRSGGNKKDWERWAKEVTFLHDAGLETEWLERVVVAKIHENARGPGTINVALTSSRTESGFEGIPTPALLTAVDTHLEEMRPLGIWDYSTFATVHDDVAVQIAITSDQFSDVSVLVANQIDLYIKSLLPGQPLSVSMLLSIAFSYGATDADVISPANNLSAENGPDAYSRFWPSSIEVTEL